MKIALYPGSFDPITNGHIDVLERACAIFDKIIVGVAHNVNKGCLFEKELRVQLVQASIEHLSQVDVMAFDGLTVDFAKKVGAIAVVRGLRAVSDFEYEFQMAQMNEHLDKEIETVLFVPRQHYFYTSSSLVKQVAEFDPDRIKSFVPECVFEALKHRKE